MSAKWISLRWPLCTLLTQVTPQIIFFSFFPYFYFQSTGWDHSVSVNAFRKITVLHIVVPLSSRLSSAKLGHGSLVPGWNTKQASYQDGGSDKNASTWSPRPYQLLCVDLQIISASPCCPHGTRSTLCLAALKKKKLFGVTGVAADTPAATPPPLLFDLPEKVFW